MTCVRGKEKLTISELTDVFEQVCHIEYCRLLVLTNHHLQLGSELWPETDVNVGGDPDDDNELVEDVEKAIAKEVATMKKPKKEKRFGTFLWMGDLRWSYSMIFSELPDQYCLWCVILTS